MKILTFNAWLLESPFFRLNIAKDIDWRLQQLPIHLKASGADIIFLQEIWKPKFKKFIEKEMKKLGFFSTYVEAGRLGRLGNGLMILSKFPFKNRCALHTFKKFTRSDESLCRKGVLTNVIEHPKAGDILLANTHIGAANFNPQKGVNPQHHKRQLNQKKEMVQFLKNIFQNKDHFIFGADLNIHDHPWSVENKNYDTTCYQPGYELVVEELNLKDSYRITHPQKRHPSYKGDTYSSKNKYTKGLSNFGFSLDERVDYIFVNDADRMFVSESKIIFKDSFLDDRHLSDHYGLLSIVEFN